MRSGSRSSSRVRWIIRHCSSRANSHVGVYPAGEAEGEALSATALAAGAAAGLTLLLMPPVLAVLRRLDALDHPNQRSSHEVPTLRGGGIAPWLACLAVVGVAPGIGMQARISLVIIAVGFGLLGAVEDLHGLSTGGRFLTQLVVAAAAAYTMHPLLGPGAWRFFVLPLVVLWVVAYVNAFNFMDGINGISAAQAIAAGVGFAVMGAQVGNTQLAITGGLVAGAALGFAPFNFPTARVFLGDAGSYFLGGWLALLAVIALASGVPPEAVASPFLIYLADTGVTLGKRMLRGEAWRQPHREHVYQRLTKMGWSHAMTTGWVLIAIVGCIALGVAATGTLSLGRIGAVSAMAGVVILYVASPALVHRFAAQRAAKP